jgi:anti-anti-sigma factor
MYAIQRQREGVAVVELKGTVHCEDGDRALEGIVNDLTSRGYIRLVINLKEVTHIDSMCLGVFVAAHVRFRKRGGAVGLLQTPPRIRQLLSVTRLDQFLPTYATEEEAICHVVAASLSHEHEAGDVLADS